MEIRILFPDAGVLAKAEKAIRGFSTDVAVSARCGVFPETSDCASDVLVCSLTTAKKAIRARYKGKCIVLSTGCAGNIGAKLPEGVTSAVFPCKSDPQGDGLIKQVALALGRNE